MPQRRICAPEVQSTGACGIGGTRRGRSGAGSAVLALLSGLIAGCTSLFPLRSLAYGEKTMQARISGDELPTVLQQRPGISQHLNQQLPLDAAFVDSIRYQPVKLGDYFDGKHPGNSVRMVYYNCPMLCSEETGRSDERAGDGESDGQAKTLTGRGRSRSIQPRRHGACGRGLQEFLPEALRPGPRRQRDGTSSPVSKPAIDAAHKRRRLRLREAYRDQTATLTQFAHASSIRDCLTPGGQSGTVLPRCGIFTEGSSCLGLVEASGNKYWISGGKYPYVLLPLRSTDQPALAHCGPRGATRRHVDGRMPRMFSFCYVPAATFASAREQVLPQYDYRRRIG